MDQIIIVCLVLVSLFFTLYLAKYKADQGIKYRNDERWNYVLAKPNMITQKYDDFLLLIVSIIGIMSVFIPIHFTFSTTRVLIILYLCLSYRNVIETLTLKYYDQRV